MHVCKKVEKTELLESILSFFTLLVEGSSCFVCFFHLHYCESVKEGLFLHFTLFLCIHNAVSLCKIEYVLYHIHSKEGF